MYKVLIVDDEKKVRISLKTMIRWENEGFCADYSARDGIDALRMVQKCHPHLIIVDIIMPNMNGIEFIKTVRNIGYKGEILILSDSRNFLYAVEGLRNHVCDYIVKTDITPTLLSQCLSRIKYRLDSRFALSSKKENLFPTADDPTILSDTLNDPAHAAEHLLSKPYFMLDIFLVMDSGISSSETRNLTQTLWRLVSEYAKGSECHILHSTAASVFIIIPQQSANLDTAKSVIAITESLQTHFRFYSNANCGFLLSPVFRSSKQFANLLLSIPQAEKQILYHNFGEIVKWEEHTHYLDQAIDTKKTIQTLRKAMDEGNFYACKSIFSKKVLQLKTQQYLPANTIHFMEQVFSFALLHNTILLADSHELADKIKDEFYHSHTLKQYIRCFNQLMDFLSSKPAKISGLSVRKEILEIEDYIHSNIDKKITLSMIAEHINMSTNYTSRLFKTETGINLMSHINQSKIHRSLFLLENPNISVHDISFALGFEEVPYFNRLFQKFCKISPTAYRKQILATVQE